MAAHDFPRLRRLQIYAAPSPNNTLLPLFSTSKVQDLIIVFPELGQYEGVGIAVTNLATSLDQGWPSLRAVSVNLPSPDPPTPSDMMSLARAQILARRRAIEFTYSVGAELPEHPGSGSLVPIDFTRPEYAEMLSQPLRKSSAMVSSLLERMAREGEVESISRLLKLLSPVLDVAREERL